MMIDSFEYYSRYDNLSNMIIRAYTIRYMIESIGEQEPFPSGKFNAVGYIDEILIYMFGLIIWQIYCDTNSKANTLQHLHHYINGTDAKTPKIHIKKNLKNDLNRIRKEYLAHNDKEQAKIRIAMDDLYKLLDELKRWLNLLCCPKLDSRVSEITDEKLASLKEEVYLSLEPLLSKAINIKRGSAHV